MVPIKEAINSDSWLHCEKRDNLFESNQFRLRIVSFNKLNLTDIDEPEKIFKLEHSAVLYLLNIEVVNLNKVPTAFYKNVDSLILIDNDGFNFPVFSDAHLNFSSDFALTSGLKKFYSGALIPKIKTSGSLVFQLPDDQDAVYYIGLENNGIIQEI